MLKKISSHLSLVDLLHFAYIAFLILLLCCSALRDGYFLWSFMLYVTLFVFLIWLVNLRQKIKKESTYFWLYFCYPIIYLFVIFQSLTWLLPAFNHGALLENRYDPILYAIDMFLVEVHPVLWFEKRAHPLLTDFMYVLYAYYFFLPFILMVLLFSHKKYREMQDSFFILAFSFYMSYIGYILIPARGPRFYLELEPLQGMFIAESLRNFINSLEPNKYDAFPSVHQLINVVILLLAYNYERMFFYVTIPISIGITISLFYCQYHYLIDVIAGSLLAIIFFITARKILDWASGSFREQLLSEDKVR